MNGLAINENFEFLVSIAHELYLYDSIVLQVLKTLKLKINITILKFRKKSGQYFTLVLYIDTFMWKVHDYDKYRN